MHVLQGLKFCRCSVPCLREKCQNRILRLLSGDCRSELIQKGLTVAVQGHA